MTREETKEAIKVMQAFVDGKKIEFFNGGNWRTIDNPCWEWNEDAQQYRIKPEPKYRPYKNAEECLKDVIKHGGWVKGIVPDCAGYHHIQSVLNSCIVTHALNASYGYLPKVFVWADDGTPCGVRED